jgi:Flp pilus assembly protein TadG
MNHQRQTSDRHGERGTILATAALGMLAFLFAAGLAVDISHFYTVKAELQNAADAAAMAAASQLNSSRGGIILAVAEATKTLNKYDMKTDVTLSSANVTFATNLNGSYMSAAAAQSSPQNIRFVKVDIPPKPVNVFFATLAIGSTKSLSATATAGMSVGLTMNKFNAALLFVEADAAPLLKNQAYTLNSKAWNVNTPGSYRILDGPNVDEVLTGTIHTYNYPVSGYTIEKLSDVDACQRARIGFNSRFGDYSAHPGSNTTNAPPDTITQENITYNQYRDLQSDNTPDRADGVLNRRILFLPIAKSSQYNTSGSATSDRLGAFFIKRKVTGTCTIEVEYIGERQVMPVGEYRPGSTQATEFSIAVIYK